jgi:hypothetical protein
VWDKRVKIFETKEWKLLWQKSDELKKTKDLQYSLLGHNVSKVTLITNVCEHYKKRIWIAQTINIFLIVLLTNCSLHICINLLDLTTDICDQIYANFR